MMGSGSPVPSNHEFFPLSMSRMGVKPTHLVTTAAALHLSSFIHHRLRLRFQFPSSSLKQYTSHLGNLLSSPPVWHERASTLAGINILQLSYEAISSKCMSLYFFKGNEDKNNSSNVEKGSGRALFNRRKWTNILLAVNVVIYMAQFATRGRLLFWGAKINSLIEKGQFWRLITSSLLHANLGHLMVNCYSLNSIGPTVENISGPKRFLAVYMTSAIASSAMSYCLCKAPAVGASGAIFGLVGSFAVFALRHKSIFKGSEQDLRHIMRVIVLNMVIGILSNGIDNWGHLGGLLGGAATSWLLGPAWKLESGSKGYKVFADRAPIFTIMKIAKAR